MREKPNLKFLDHYVNQEPTPDIDYDSGAEIRRVSSHELPSSVLGMYHPTSHTIHIRNDLSQYQETFVRAHESAHAQGLIDEHRTDLHAASKVGYNLREMGRYSLAA